jgi:hypothetical protein
MAFGARFCHILYRSTKKCFFFVAEVYKEILVPNFLVGDEISLLSTRKFTMKFGIAQALYCLLPFV